MSVIKNILLNGFAQVASRLVKVADQLVLIPLFLSKWGADYYGEWLTLSIIPSVLAVSDLGFGSAAANAFVISYNAGKEKEAADILKTSILSISGLIFFSILISSCVLFALYFFHVFDKSLIPPLESIIALLFLLSARFACFYEQLFEGVFRSVHKAATSTNFVTFQGLLCVLIGALCLLLGYGVVGFSVGQFIGALLFNAIFIKCALYVLPELPKGDWIKDKAKDILKTGMGFMLTPIWQSIYMQGSTFVVRVVLGPYYVTIFNTVRTVSRSLTSVYLIIYGSIFPELQIAYGKGDLKLMKSIYIYSVRFAFSASLIGFVFLAIWGLPIYNWWTQYQLSFPGYMWDVFMAGIVFNALWWIASVIFRAINQPYYLSFCGLASSAFSILLSFILAKLYGLVGAAIGFLMMDVLMTLLVFPKANKIVGLQLLDLFKIKKV